MHDPKTHLPRHSATALALMLACAAAPAAAQEAGPVPSRPEAAAPAQDPAPAAPAAQPADAGAAAPAVDPAVDAAAQNPALAQAEPTDPADPAAPAETPDAETPDAVAPTADTPIPPAQEQPADPATPAGADAPAPDAQAPDAQAPAAQAQPAPATPPAAPGPLSGLTNLLPEDIARQLTTERRDDLPHDLSPWGMFMAADWVVKAVMIGLAIASLLTWTIWLAKTVEIFLARRRATAAANRIMAARSLADFGPQVARNGGGPARAMLRSATQELTRSAPALDHAGAEGLRNRVALALSRIEARAGRRLSRGTGILATIGSTAPFVGLFGTVWGIMNSFIGISEAQTTNLAIVAPGIAEALLATAIGLVAAIPAVVFYNVFARSIAGYRQILGDAATGVEVLVSRDLDFRLVPAPADVTAKAAE